MIVTQQPYYVIITCGKKTLRLKNSNVTFFLPGNFFLATHRNNEPTRKSPRAALVEDTGATSQLTLRNDDPSKHDYKRTLDKKHKKNQD